MSEESSQMRGVPAFDLRLVGVGHRQPEPYALVVGVADSGVVTQVAAGTRKEMRSLRNRMLIALRQDRSPLESLASALAGMARSLSAESTP